MCQRGETEEAGRVVKGVVGSTVPPLSDRDKVRSPPWSTEGGTGDLRLRGCSDGKVRGCEGRVPVCLSL